MEGKIYLTKEEAEKHVIKLQDEKRNFISELNEQIAQINAKAIQKHIEANDLEEWLDDWKVKTAAISFGLFYEKRKIKNALKAMIEDI